MFSWNSLAFFYDSANVGNLISGSSALSKSSLNSWKFLVHVLLKPPLENSEHYCASVWDESQLLGCWLFFKLACYTGKYLKGMSQKRNRQKANKKKLLMKQKASWLNTKTVVLKRKKSFGRQGILIYSWGTEQGKGRGELLSKAPPNSKYGFYLSQILNREIVWRYNSLLALM